jgi:hypothetical protein
VQRSHENLSIGDLTNAKDIKIIACLHVTGAQARCRSHILKLELPVCGTEVVQPAQWMLTKEKDIKLWGVFCGQINFRLKLVVKSG